MSSDPVLVERVDSIATITLNRPESRNAMDVGLTEAFTNAVESIGQDASVRAVIVTGAGKAFCAGGDLSWIDPGPHANVPDIRTKMRTFYRQFLRVRDLDVPVIAALNGPAVGAGLCLALACDMRIAASNGSLSATFTKLGMHPGMAATYLLTRLVGSARASDMFFTGRTVSAEEASAIGLVNEVVAPEDLAARAREIAEQIAANAPIPMGMAKRAIYLAEQASMETMLEYEGLAQPITMATDDLLEGIIAIREKRPPIFRGR